MPDRLKYHDSVEKRCQVVLSWVGSLQANHECYIMNDTRYSAFEKALKDLEKLVVDELRDLEPGENQLIQRFRKELES